MLAVRAVPIDTITLRDDFLRLQFDGAKYTELVNSIRQLGILSPLIALDTSEGLVLVSGYRRYQAAKEINLPTIPCICLKAGIDDAEILRMHENLYREDVSPIQEAVCFLRLEQTYHFTREKISKLIGKSKAYITQRIQILDWPDSLQQALSSGSISYSVARELSAVTDQPELTRLLDTCIQSGATVRTVLSWVQEWKSSLSSPSSSSSSSPSSSPSSSSSLSSSPCYLCGHYHPIKYLTTINICKECLDVLDESPPTPDQDPPQDPQANPPH